MTVPGIYPIQPSMTSSKVTSDIEDVDPVTAARWLGGNQTNRNLRPALVAKYASDMRNGQWIMAGEPIKFDSEGSLLDGQHRLAAIVKSDLTVEMMVVRGLPAQSRVVMDSGSARTAGDQLHMLGYQGHSQAIAAAARLIIAWRRGELFTGAHSWTITNSDIVGFVEATPTIVDTTYSAVRVARRTGASPAPTAAAMYLTSQRSADDAQRFWQAMREDVVFPPDSPIEALLRRLGEIRREGKRLLSVASLSMQIRTWNAWREGRPVRLVKPAVEGRVIQVKEIK